MPYVYSPEYSLTITKDGVDEDVTNDTRYFECNNPDFVKQGIGKFKLILYNSDQKYSGRYLGGETLTFKADNNDGSTTQFVGRLEKPVQKNTDGFTKMEITGVHDSALMIDSKVNSTFSGTGLSTVATSIAPSGFGTGNIESDFTPINTAFSYISPAEAYAKLSDLSNSGKSGYVDNSKNIYFFDAGSKDHGTSMSVIEAGGGNFVSAEGFGQDVGETITKVRVFGKNGIMAVAGSGTKEKPITDESITTDEQARERANAELLISSPKKGRVRCLGLSYYTGSGTNVPLPGYKIQVGIPSMLLNQKFVINNVTHVVAEDGLWYTELDLEDVTSGIAQIFRERMRAEQRLSSVSNPFNMDFSYNFSFADSGKIESMGNAKVQDGKLMLQDGYSSSTSVSVTKTFSSRIKAVSAVFTNVNDLEDSIVEVSVDNGANYITVAKDTLYNIADGDRGFDLKVRFTLKKTTDRPTPWIDDMTINLQVE